MLSQLSILFAVFAAVYANGEFVVLHLPDSIEFTINERGRIEQSYLKEILSACLGYTGKQKDLEHSIVCNIRNPFSVPKALIAIVVEGTEHLPSLKDKAKVTCPLIYDEVEESTWQAIRSRVDERSNDNTLVRINLSDGVDALGQSALGELKPLKIEKLTALNSDIEEDRKFVEEVELLYAIGDIASSAKKHDSDTDVYWLVVSTLKPCLEMHGNNSAAKKEAHQLLSDAIEHVSKGFLNIYNGKIIIAIFTNDGLKVRNARSVLERKRRDDPPRAGEQDEQNNKMDEEEYRMRSTIKSNTALDSTTERTGVQDNSGTSEKSDEVNTEYKINTNTQTIGQPEFSGRAKTYTEDYPVIFNIMLWFGVVFVFSLLAICIAIANMDPGRDSIIYRMTSNRMKKDN
ncbi:PREDICTED: renin receptor isoform X1 [Trachymyrmex septentrionalis]|uniref:renin receptor isoform X1 n=1 Tax=Trachymyrmex septentrionalis TaxID=34720 RepID=UPI00084F6207|nr:PREDICTED: renin receptor isoform X1 [Trachymyrmex septentrionalis]